MSRWVRWERVEIVSLPDDLQDYETGLGSLESMAFKEIGADYPILILYVSPHWVGFEIGKPKRPCDALQVTGEWFLDKDEVAEGGVIPVDIAVYAADMLLRHSKSMKEVLEKYDGDGLRTAESG